MINTVPVASKDGLSAFIDFPHELYKDDSKYVPELFIAQRDLLTPGKHPFHEHSRLHSFLLYDGNRLVGRITAIINTNHDKFNNTTDGFFGFFECGEQYEYAKQLLDEARAWLKKEGATTMIGPVNFSTNETCGLLTDGFDSPPMAMMTYNKPYYLNYFEKYGLQKYTDLLAYEIATVDANDKSLKLEEALNKRLSAKGITIRKVNLKNFRQETEQIKEVYNSAWDKNLGFVPMTDAEFTYLAKDLKLIIDKDFCYVAEHEGKLIGFFLALPDINQALIHVKKGRLLPTGLFKLLYHKTKINQLRVITMGVVEGYRKQGIEASFYSMAIREARRKKIVRTEASWILENNVLMNQALVNINAKIYKKYRIFRKEI